MNCETLVDRVSAALVVIGLAGTYIGFGKTWYHEIKSDNARARLVSLEYGTKEFEDTVTIREENYDEVQTSLGYSLIPFGLFTLGYFARKGKPL